MSDFFECVIVIVIVIVCVVLFGRQCICRCSVVTGLVESIEVIFSVGVELRQESLTCNTGAEFMTDRGRDAALGTPTDTRPATIATTYPARTLETWQARDET